MLSNRTSIYRSKTLHVSVIVRGYLMKNLLKISLTLAGKEKKKNTIRRITDCFRAHRLKTCEPFIKNVMTFISVTFSTSCLF